MASTPCTLTRSSSVIHSFKHTSEDGSPASHLRQKSLGWFWPKRWPSTLLVFVVIVPGSCVCLFLAGAGCRKLGTGNSRQGQEARYSVGWDRYWALGPSLGAWAERLLPRPPRQAARVWFGEVPDLGHSLRLHAGRRAGEKARVPGREVGAQFGWLSDPGHPLGLHAGDREGGGDTFIQVDGVDVAREGGSLGHSQDLHAGTLAGKRTNPSRQMTGTWLRVRRDPRSLASSRTARVPSFFRESLRYIVPELKNSVISKPQHFLAPLLFLAPLQGVSLITPCIVAPLRLIIPRDVARRGRCYVGALLLVRLLVSVGWGWSPRAPADLGLGGGSRKTMSGSTATARERARSNTGTVFSSWPCHVRAFPLALPYSTVFVDRPSLAQSRPAPNASSCSLAVEPKASAQLDPITPRPPRRH